MQGGVLLNRIQPGMPAANYKSYSLRAPLSTHWRKATCEEYECEAFRFGWVTLVDTATELGQLQAHYIRHDRSRRHHEDRGPDTMVSFTFLPGQEMFPCESHNHRVGVGRPPLMLVTGGDWRGNPRGTPTVNHRRIEDWIDDCASHQERLARAQR